MAYMKIKEKKSDHEDHDHDDFSKVLTVRKNIYLFGEINVNSTGNFLAALQEADSKPGLISVSICSGGGWVEGGLAMFDAIRSSKNEILTVACGAVYSAAVLPFQAGDIRGMHRSARLFFHPISLGIGEASLNALNAVTKETERLYQLYCDHVAERSGLPSRKVGHLCEVESYLDINDCAALGLTDIIYEYNDNKYVEPQMKPRKKLKRVK